VTARKLGTLDESKVIPAPRPVEQAPRLLTAPEMASAEEVGRDGDAVEGGRV
jgi:hypothetical protein